MLKTNNKKVKQKIEHYVRQAADYLKDCGYSQVDGFNLNNYSELCHVVYEVFKVEKHHYGETFEIFVEWAQGLALNLFDYYYNVSAVQLVGDILEQTEQERNRYTERQAELLMTKLIYRSIIENKGGASNEN